MKKIDLHNTKKAKLNKILNKGFDYFGRSIKTNNFNIKKLKRAAKRIIEPTGETFDQIQKLYSENKRFRKEIKHHEKN